MSPSLTSDRSRALLRPSALTLAVAAALVTAMAGCSPDAGDPTAGNSTTGTEGDTSLADLPSPTLPAQPFSYASKLPAHFQTPQVHHYDNTPADNPTTDAGAALGRVLFYDKHLSKNGTVACASCHQQSHGFSDSRELSLGFEGQKTARHSMPVIDTRFYARRKFFWDERAPSLEAQVLGPIQSEVEMGMTLDLLVDRVAETDYYPPLFQTAFGDSEVTSDRISRALAQFLRSLVSYQSRWDAAVAQVSSIGGDLPGFTAQENRGKQIFFGQHDPTTRGLCGTCHLMQNELAFVPPGMPAPPAGNKAVFYMGAPADNGLSDDGDKGVGAADGKAQDEGKFKAPSLRNVALRAPYMHDGHIATLEELVDHYDSDIQPHQNLDPALRAGGPAGTPMRLHLSSEDKAALVAFLGTLTDETLAKDVRFSSPFPTE
jgi:cytochrome c peroxidase